MNTLNSNSPSELLNLMIDGEIGAEGSAELHKLMADDTSLQSEFSELMKIRNSVHNDSEAFTPPVEAREFIFGQIGFESISKVAPPAASWMSRYLIPGSAAIIASIVTAFVVWNVSDKPNDIAKENTKVQEISNSVATKNAVSNAIPMISSSEEISNAQKLNSLSNVKSNSKNHSNNHSSHNSNSSNSINTFADENLANYELKNDGLNNDNLKNENVNLDLANENAKVETTLEQVSNLNTIDFVNQNFTSYPVLDRNSDAQMMKVNSDMRVSNSFKSTIFDIRGLSQASNTANSNLEWMIGAYYTNQMNFLGAETEYRVGGHIGQSNFKLRTMDQVSGIIKEGDNESALILKPSAEVIFNNIEILGIAKPFIAADFGYALNGILISRESLGLEFNSSVIFGFSNLNVYTAYQLGQNFQIVGVKNSTSNNAIIFGANFKF